MSNESDFWKARDEHYAEKDDLPTEECRKCEGKGAYLDDVVLHDEVECEKCEGSGEVFSKAGCGFGMFV
jgi:DnaJ-class molecular chaperone